MSLPILRSQHSFQPLLVKRKAEKPICKATDKNLVFEQESCKKIPPGISDKVFRPPEYLKDRKKIVYAYSTWCDSRIDRAVKKFIGNKRKNYQKDAFISECLKYKSEGFYASSLEIKHTGDAKMGYGVYVKKSADPIASRQIIGIYAGSLVDLHQDKNWIKHDYLFSLDIDERWNRYGIDAQKRGNFTREINHSRNPNVFASCYLRKITPGKEGRGTPYILLKTKKTIEPGEQLFLNYGRQYWSDRGIQPIKIEKSSMVNE